MTLAISLNPKPIRATKANLGFRGSSAPASTLPARIGTIGLLHHGEHGLLELVDEEGDEAPPPRGGRPLVDRGGEGGYRYTARSLSWIHTGSGDMNQGVLRETE
ncbi:hypothetical protein VE00_09045 [Pseudogymnoascus sp. WSF 3629]|nr:hypothetical protein VE00_09045 [Pseudogymnoascus sp. WSF 3629]